MYSIYPWKHLRTHHFASSQKKNILGLVACRYDNVTLSPLLLPARVYESVPFNVMEQIKMFVPWIFQLSFCICVHNLLFSTISWYEISVTIPVSTFTIDFVFENCFLSAMTPYVDSRVTCNGRSLSIYGSECQIWKTFTTMKFTSMLLIWQSIQIRISPKRGKCTWNSNL